MERCPKCDKMGANINHNTGLLSCTYRTCGYDEHRLPRDERVLLLRCLAEIKKQEALERIGDARVRQIKEYAKNRDTDIFEKVEEVEEKLMGRELAFQVLREMSEEKREALYKHAMEISDKIIKGMDDE